MKRNDKKINELADSWDNGNKGYVRSKVKTINKLEFAYLVIAIRSLTNDDEERLINSLVGNY